MCKCKNQKAKSSIFTDAILDSVEDLCDHLEKAEASTEVILKSLRFFCKNCKKNLKEDA